MILNGFRVPTDQKTHVVYSIPCSDCEKVYMGQTKGQFCTRLKEHQRAVSNFNSSKSALTELVCETNHNIAWDVSTIITMHVIMSRFIPGCDIATNFSSVIWLSHRLCSEREYTHSLYPSLKLVVQLKKLGMYI